eukprot:TRINITY_DN462_c0_g1::TRINITY_DN462_c0_g1_i1::g.2466::m.2466 TRINITY_DN462_c0_g1::TRINITY_DN462_c0_g1_i1::g.2466  ORF type:complete len:222 (+),score=-12.55,sp/P26857/COX2_MARPO/41.74/6e-57,COX2/PF00116.15/3.2e-37,COX2_TM/PF02790.10/1.9e-11 TRINITY_DN462_c0_g1_i1:39-704(+)
MEGVKEVKSKKKRMTWRMEDASGLFAQALLAFNTDLVGALVFLGTLVLWLLVRGSWLNFESKKAVAFDHHSMVEFVWTMVPAVFLLILMLPSFTLLYYLQDMGLVMASRTVIGSQWFWTYGETDSYMVPEESLEVGELRLLEVDNRLQVPALSATRVLITANDVLHSFAIPALAIKADACPGRLNVVTLLPTIEGTYYGRCSELCGSGHGFMPIALDVTSL